MHTAMLAHDYFNLELRHHQALQTFFFMQFSASFFFCAQRYNE